jgi:hypothetical protein
VPLEPDRLLLLAARDLVVALEASGNVPIEYWVREYGELLEQPDLWDTTRQLLDG